MTKHLEDTLELRHLDEILEDEKVIEPETHITALDAQIERQRGELAKMRQSADNLILSGEDHANKTDTIYKECLDQARQVMELGFNMDPARAPRAFEVGTGLYKTALDATNSKRDAQLKAMKLMLDQQKLELERRSAGEEIVDDAVETKAVVVEDRNKLIQRLRDEAKAEKAALDALDAERKANEQAAKKIAAEGKDA